MAPIQHLTIMFLLTSFSLPLVAQDWGETEPYIQWSSEQAYKILYRSPWVSLISGGFRPVEQAGRNRDGTLHPTTAYYRFYYRVSLLTARPIREALLRLYSLSSVLIDVAIFDAVARAENERSRLTKLIQSSPEDVRVTGNGQYIIVGLTGMLSTQRSTWEEVPSLSPEYWREDSPLDESTNIDSAKLLKDTTLSTDNAKHVKLFRYEPPGTDGLGAKFYFPRTLPNGVSLVTSNDRELVFETRINRKKIRARFDLRKMISRGKLEM
jgi:hypothetical protein